MKESNESMRVIWEVEGRTAKVVFPASDEDERVEVATITLAKSAIDDWDDQLFEDLLDSFQDWLSRNLDCVGVRLSDVQRYMQRQRN